LALRAHAHAFGATEEGHVVPSLADRVRVADTFAMSRNAENLASGPDERPPVRTRSRYSAATLDHFRNPRNVGPVHGANIEVTVGDPSDGDTMRIYARVRGGRIEAAGFHTLGCVAAIAASSVLTELLEGRTLDEALAIRNATVADALGGLSPDKLHCSVLAEDAIRRLVEQARVLAV
jgi:nitrogen fixation NifU-like protein